VSHFATGFYTVTFFNRPLYSSAKAEGADFNAKFLRIANIVDEKSKR
jgi:hypothetical protein